MTLADERISILWAKKSPAANRIALALDAGVDNLAGAARAAVDYSGEATTHIFRPRPYPKLGRDIRDIRGQVPLSHCFQSYLLCPYFSRPYFGKISVHLDGDQSGTGVGRQRIDIIAGYFCVPTVPNVPTVFLR